MTTKGKYTALEADAILPLVELVNDACSEVRANALKVEKKNILMCLDFSKCETVDIRVNHADFWCKVSCSLMAPSTG